MRVLDSVVKKVRQNNIVFQSEEAECGLACMTILLRHYGADANINDLRAGYGSTRGVKKE